MNKTLVINAVGLTPALLGPATPRLGRFAQAGKLATIAGAFPTLTCTAQATYLTAASPREHGIVANGWYFRDECEIKFWRQSSFLVQRPRIWDIAKRRDPAFTCANLFWWYAMYSNADVTVTPRPMYPSDGRKLPDVWTNPPDLRGHLQDQLGTFPLFQFWGPTTSIAATRWIADAAIMVDRQYSPTLTLVYLPHLDYILQKAGPDAPAVAVDLGQLDAVCGDLLDHFQAAGASIIILSEYGMLPVSRPVHLNRVLRGHGLLSVREELGRELLDAGASTAFAVADHQVAHVYVNDSAQIVRVKALLEATEGVARVLDGEGKKAMGLDHPRSGELVVLAQVDSWFTYYYWLDDRRMPDFARTVDIHRKSGYDPVELFLDPRLAAPKLKIAATLLKRKLGLRSLMKVIGTDASLVRGSHGLPCADPLVSPLLITNRPELLDTPRMEANEVCGLILKHITGTAEQ